jgi:hypothetical protein
MAHSRQLKPSRRLTAPDDPATEFLQTEVERLREAVAALQLESAGHIRRFGELQLEIDALKKALSVPDRGRLAG